MSRQLIAIGLDATDPHLLERWMDAGHLPRLSELRAQGGFGLVQNVDYYRTETSWLNYLTGRMPSETGNWGHVVYDPKTYGIDEQNSFRFDNYPPFYAGLDDLRCAIVDPPLARDVNGVNGIQVLGWGTEVNQCLRVSRPPELMEQLLEQHGAHPLLVGVPGADEALLTYAIPSAYEVPALKQLSRQLCMGARQRSALFRDLLSREPWDFFLGVFSETHTANHLLWHLSQEHPLRASLARELDHDPMLAVFQAVDQALGEIVDTLSANCDLLLFSIYGIGANVLDLPSMLFLPELLYRFSKPGGSCLSPRDGGEEPPGLAFPGHWKQEVWKRRSPQADPRLASPTEQERAGDPLNWQPANWMRPLWPEMTAFALPTYSEGLIRLNVRGREAAGTVMPEDFSSTCDALCAFLREVKDARSGRPMVRDIVRTRSSPEGDSEFGAPADLIVLWQEEAPTDAVTSPVAGRVGPMPYFRSGGHCPRGFVLQRDADTTAGSTLPPIHAKDLTSHFLSRLRG